MSEFRKTGSAKIVTLTVINWTLCFYNAVMRLNDAEYMTVVETLIRLC